MSYPGGKSGAGIYQRLINLIPRHRILIVPFAGHCGVVRNIRPAEHTIVIDQNPTVCQWWADWSRSKKGRDLEIHNCDGIEWLRHRLSDEDHQRFLGTATQLDATRYRMMICGYSCDLYSPLDGWFSIDHRVPTRGGLQDERIWMNYPKPVQLHDYQYIGDTRRSRERIRRRQKNWREQLNRMSEQERLAMLEVLNTTRSKP